MKHFAAELHTHTVFSDGTMTPSRLAERAAERGYDAIAVTDHNTVFGATETIARAKTLPLVCVAGIEWTTFWGHVTVLGGASPVNWREVNLENFGAMTKRAAESGDAVVIAHPTRIGGCICTGCHFDYLTDDLSCVHAVEVMSQHNPVSDGANGLARALWHGWLSRGYRLGAVNGYDWHNEDVKCPAFAKTYIVADGELSSQKLVQAVREGRTYASVGLHVEVAVLAGGRTFGLGDTLPQGQAHVIVSVTRDCPFADEYAVYPHCIRICGTALAASAEGYSLELDAQIQKGYFVVEIDGVCGTEQGTLAVTSPVYAE